MDGPPSNIAPEIERQRLLIEGYYSVTVDEDVIVDYFDAVTAALELSAYGKPIVHAPAAGAGRPENAGFDAFLPLIDSGISLYVWTGPRFLSVILYTCRAFDQRRARETTRDFFELAEGFVTRAF